MSVNREIHDPGRQCGAPRHRGRPDLAAEELHFGRTAERLHVTPARVSQAIKKQERAIGAALFERTSRVVRLTPAGEQLRDDLEPGYRQIRQAIGGAAATVRGISGTVRVGFSGPWCGDLIVKAAEAFQDRYPACAVQSVERLLADRFGALRAGAIDQQLAQRPADEPASPRPDPVPGAARAPGAARPPPRRQKVHHARGLRRLRGHHRRERARLLPRLPRVPRRTPSGRPVRRGPTALSFQEAQSPIGAGKGVQPTSPARG